MSETYCLDCLKVTLEADVTPDRSPKTSTVARDYCKAVLEDIDRKSLLLCCNLSLKLRCSVNFTVLDVELSDLLAFDVNEDC